MIGVCAVLTASIGQAQDDGELASVQASPSWYAMTFSDGVEIRVLPPAVTFKDYPTMAVRNDVEGTSMLKLLVDPSGQIASCTIAQSAGMVEMDEAACLLYRTRARFVVRGATQPVELIAPMRWVLADPE
jgi:TonB family protein